MYTSGHLIVDQHVEGDTPQVTWQLMLDKEDDSEAENGPTNEDTTARNYHVSMEMVS